MEAHIDRLHAQLLEYVKALQSLLTTNILLNFSLGWWPVAFETLDPFKGLNSKTAKVFFSPDGSGCLAGNPNLLASRAWFRDFSTMLPHTD